ncbi:SCO4225 family membrane protein [Actinokineospora sp. G85]|uniref:SCO4225 family membrane protein n=1 Tax=Actinokineospora sp. G85 TaxID=3406626 RepID=UPI003C72CF21
MTTWSNRRGARRAALVYLVVVTAVFIGVALTLALHEGPDASFAAVLAFAVTLPSSLVILLLPDFPTPVDGIVGSAALVAAALFQAWLLWLVFRGHRTP